jgi:hypothetical protein
MRRKCQKGNLKSNIQVSVSAGSLNTLGCGGQKNQTRFFVEVNKAAGAKKSNKVLVIR